mmetsp:Transcript_8511/g.20214  ORF Transcript_8511/g.20214 Transcript_8511/m.20214 type:complete len:272 (+) Transcript_8511:442-1257(+)
MCVAVGQQRAEEWRQTILHCLRPVAHEVLASEIHRCQQRCHADETKHASKNPEPHGRRDLHHGLQVAELLTFVVTCEVQHLSQEAAPFDDAVDLAHLHLELMQRSLVDPDCCQVSVDVHNNFSTATLDTQKVLAEPITDVHDGQVSSILLARSAPFESTKHRTDLLEVFTDHVAVKKIHEAPWLAHGREQLLRRGQGHHRGLGRTWLAGRLVAAQRRVDGLTNLALERPLMLARQEEVCPEVCDVRLPELLHAVHVVALAGLAAQEGGHHL